MFLAAAVCSGLESDVALSDDGHAWYKGGDEGHGAVAIRVALRGTWTAVVKIVSFWLLILSQHLRT